jgi:hypothetical protein
MLPKSDKRSIDSSHEELPSGWSAEGQRETEWLISLSLNLPDVSERAVSAN